MFAVGSHYQVTAVKTWLWTLLCVCVRACAIMCCIKLCNKSGHHSKTLSGVTKSHDNIKDWKQSITAQPLSHFTSVHWKVFTSVASKLKDINFTVVTTLPSKWWWGCYIISCIHCTCSCAATTGLWVPESVLQMAATVGCSILILSQPSVADGWSMLQKEWAFEYS
jgi:hypothetical protein